MKTASEMTYIVSSGALNSTPTPTPGDFCRINYLNIYRTDLREIRRIGRTLGSQMYTTQSCFFFDPLCRDNQFFPAKSTSTPRLVFCMTFARAAPPAYDKKIGCYAGRSQTNCLIRWTQANQPSNRLTIISYRMFRNSTAYWTTEDV